MSNEILSQCWKLKIPQAAKFVLISLADQADNDGICWPSVGFICERTSLCDRAVQKSLKWLREHKAVRIEANAAAKGANRYTVTPDTFTPEPDSPPNDVRPEPDSPTPERRSHSPPNHVRAPPNDVRTNHQEPSTNHQEPKKKRTRERVGLGIEDLAADGVEEQVAKDWLEVRKSKGFKMLTMTAWSSVKSEAAKESITPGEAVRIAAGNNWAGFKADWVRDRKNGKPKPSAHTGFSTTDYKQEALEWNRN